MSVRATRKATGKEGGISVPQTQFNKTPKQPAKPPVTRGRKHAALGGSPKIAVSAEQWINVNRAIEKTVETVPSQNIALNSLGPDYWGMEEGLGVALIAEIRRSIKETCSLSNPKLQRQLRRMAYDVTHKEFCFPYQEGGV
ncbi:hypothetical protein AAE478_008597 [Parahypoxylon ruwenzoriense]